MICGGLVDVPEFCLPGVGEPLLLGLRLGIR